MAKVISPFGASEVRGSVASLTFSRTSAGAIVRAQPRPTHKQTALQLTQRYRHQKLTRLFSSLTLEEIAEWNDFGRSWPVSDRFGDSANLTGQTWFVKFNSPLLFTGQAVRNVPPDCPNTRYNLPTNIFFRYGRPYGIVVQFGSIAPAEWRTVFRWQDPFPLSCQYHHTGHKTVYVVNNKTRSSDSLIIGTPSTFTGKNWVIDWEGIDEYGRKTCRNTFQSLGTH